MTPEQWINVKAIVAGALAQPIANRSAYVSARCASQATRHEVDSLLASALAAEHLYDEPTLLIDGTATAIIDAFENFAARSDTALRAEPLQPIAIQPAFESTGRFTVRRQIGVGGMGIVYEVEDRGRQQTVALKTLRRWDASDIYRLKREFRSLADIAHPNLASLHELVLEEGQCFFTMELVDGVSYVDYVREGHTLHTERVRRTLPQLIDGLEELHRHGKQHRDIKPSNVLVTRVGRVVILDFGLTSDIAHDPAAAQTELVGTPAYLSPEQCAGRETTEASDWYCVGATLYHALTGRPPYEGSILDVIRSKTTIDPVPAAALAPEVPDDLNAACMGLLAREPEMRMSGREALEQIHVASVSPVAAPGVVSESAFVGRKSSLDALRAAFAAVKEGTGVTVAVHGPSGIGKSALVRHFLTRTLAGESIVALRSRCHEHESVPYKGLDGVVDGLSRYLSALSSEEARALMPRDAFALARLFPVMQIEAVMACRPDDRESADPIAVRRRAFTALRGLLDGIARRRRLILEIDDFQWADADSAATLTELLRPPNPPPLLLLVSFRTEEITAKPFLRALVDQTDAGTRLTLALKPLSDGEVGELIATLLRPTDGLSDRADATVATLAKADIAREAAGNPYLVEELTRYAALGRPADQGATLEHMLDRRLASLPSGSRDFVEALAICGRPMLSTRVFEACGLSGDERPLVARLRSAHFVRTSRSSEHVELYHDRIRETIAAGITVESVRQIHEKLARTLLGRGDDDPEALCEHYRGADQHKNAASQAARAAVRASQVLAFDRAATFYQHALNLDPASVERADWTVGLARALANAGRPPEAAEAYLAAAREAEGMQRIEWSRRGAEQLLMGGHIDRGLATIRDVLAAVGIRLAHGPRAAIFSILIGRVRLAWRGLKFTERAESAIGKEDLLKIDTCWALATGLMLVDTPCAASFNLKELQIALDAGEPYRIARALALEASFSVATGGKAAIDRSTAFVERARSLAEHVHNPHVVALALMTAGLAAFLQGYWRKATDLCDQALTILREQCTGVLWEITLAQNFYLGSLIFRGQFKYANEVVPNLLASARERGNLYFVAELTTRMSLVWLARDAADESERAAGEAMSEWSDSGFHRQHYNHFVARAQIALYRGRANDAWLVVGEHWPIIRRNMWLQVQYNRIETAFLRARAAIAMAAAGQDVTRMCDRAERDADRLFKEKMFWSDALATLVRGTLAHLKGDVAIAVEQLDDAINRFDRAEMGLYAAVTRRRLANLVGGEHRRRLQRESDQFMSDQDIKNPAAMSRLIAPGYQEI